MIQDFGRAGPAQMLTGRGALLLSRAQVPVSLLADGAPAGAPLAPDGTVSVDIRLTDGLVAAVQAPGATEGPACDLGGRQVWPMLIDMHAHLDKAHVLGRAPDSGGTHAGAREATTRDRLAHWTREDLMRRMDFALACAEGYGTAAIRTHLDSHEGQAETTWGAFDAMRARWAGRVELQGVALVPLDAYGTGHGARLADLVAANGGLLGGVTRVSGGTHGGGLDDIDALLDRLFALARERDLDVDLHVDEAAVASALPHVARAVLRHGYEGRVTCGHCCSLALLPEEEAAAVIALLAEAGVALVTLPTVNMYLQDRTPGRTPRWRGVTPVQELRAAGVPVAVAGDNTRDPFHAYGDGDMLDTWRQAVRVLHLDHPFADAPALAGAVPAAITGFAAGTIRVGRPADLMIFEAWSLDQIIARPQSDRLLVRRGALSAARPPSYAALAPHEEPAPVG
ncbi:cytosine deaminase [Haematobacter massiliensis]|uniref:Cytosine deaminase n=1 Tax=Haematobacter massiliensis TaxID=195105 RepID=A0A086XXJ1_9RHOB|nr:cytosine deaminase [Haematobacter massiliensis]KFI26741.1 cytosine deaminase [Haematobacter massiliensis]